MMCGKFGWGMIIGLAAGAALGMSFAPSKREIRRATHRAVKNVNCAVNEAMDSIASVVDNFAGMMGK